MKRINSIEELKIVSTDFRKNMELLVDQNNPDGFVLVKVATATCSNAAGAKNIFDLMTEHLDKRGINAMVSKTGCMGYCYAEPTIEVTKPGHDPIVFGYVNEERADEIIERYIKNGEEVEGIISLNYRTVEEID
jgi:NADP-reducing hydrogenase subunit HndB